MFDAEKVCGREEMAMSKIRIFIMFSLLLCIGIFASACGSKNGNADSLETSQNAVQIETKEVEISEKPKVENGTEKNSETESTQDTETVDETNDDSIEKYSVYHNPIDEYYLSTINCWDVSEVEIRAAQDDYRKAWKAEYKRLMKWLLKQCVYEEDREDLHALEESVADQIAIQRKVLTIAMTDGYAVNPDSSQIEGGLSRMSLPGNGTRSRLNQCEGEVYRDVSMRILYLYEGEKEYKFHFCETDASKYRTQE